MKMLSGCWDFQPQTPTLTPTTPPNSYKLLRSNENTWEAEAWLGPSTMPRAVPDCPSGSVLVTEEVLTAFCRPLLLLQREASLGERFVKPPGPLALGRAMGTGAVK